MYRIVYPAVSPVAASTEVYRGSKAAVILKLAAMGERADVLSKVEVQKRVAYYKGILAEWEPIGTGTEFLAR